MRYLEEFPYKSILTKPSSERFEMELSMAKIESMRILRGLINIVRYSATSNVLKFQALDYKYRVGSKCHEEDLCSFKWLNNLR